MYSNYKIKVFSAAFLVFFITLLVYLPALQNGFVNWDDHIYIYENAHITSIDPDSLMWMITTFHAGNWHPLTWLSHAVDYWLWGLDPMGHHLTSVLLHGINSFLVVVLVAVLIGMAEKIRNPKSEIRNQLIAAVITGFLFGVHPLHVESVAWASERKDVLCAFFFLLSILFYIRYASSFQENLTRTPRAKPTGHSSLVTCLPDRQARYWQYSLCLLFFIMALMSKPMAVTLPLVLIILDIYPFERIHMRGLTSRPAVLIEKVPFICLSIASSVITVIAQKRGGAIVSIWAHSILDRILVAVKALCFYLLKMLWPVRLAPIYPYSNDMSFLSFQYAGSLILFLFITALCIFLWNKNRVYLLVWGFYVVTLLPVLGIVQVGGQAAADRYTYLPSLGPFLLAGLATALLYEKASDSKNSLRSVRIPVLVILLCIAVILPIMTVKQIKIWKNSITMWRAEMKIFPDYFISYRGIGGVYAEEGKYKKALEYLNTAVDLRADDYLSHYKRGTAYLGMKKFHKALEDFDTAIRLNPEAEGAYYNRAKAHEEMGNYTEAVRDYTKAIENNPLQEKAYYNLGVIYDYHFRNYEEAIKQYTGAIGLNSGYAKAYNNRGIVFAAKGRYHDAIRDFNSAIKIDNSDSTAFYNRGLAYSITGNRVQADSDFREAERLGEKIARDHLKKNNNN